MARPSNTEQRRLQIATGMIKVMARKGYDGASIADIARAARLTPGLVHYHFKGKEEIRLAALDTLIQAHLAKLDEYVATAEGRPLDEIGAFIDYHLALGTTADPEALACWNHMSGEALRDKKVRDRFEQAMAGIASRVAASIRRGVERWELSCDDPDSAAAALVATVQGYYVLGASARNAIPKGSAARCTRAMADGLLRPTHSLTKEPRRK